MNRSNVLASHALKTPSVRSTILVRNTQRGLRLDRVTNLSDSTNLQVLWNWITAILSLYIRPGCNLRYYAGGWRYTVEWPLGASEPTILPHKRRRL